jgi:hypothetical protein
MKRRGWSPTMKSTQKSATVGTLAYYGPNTELALKVSAAVLGRDGQVHDVTTWRSISDVRHEVEIAEKIATHFRSRGVHVVAVADGIVDCAHEDRNVCGCDDSIYVEENLLDDDEILGAITDAGIEVRVVSVVAFHEAQQDAGRRIVRMNAKMAEEQASGKVEPWFLYFTDLEKSAGQRFLGACIVEAPGFVSVIDRAHQLGINPGGAVVAYDTPKHDLSFRNRLITSDAEMAQLGYVRRTA